MNSDTLKACKDLLKQSKQLLAQNDLAGAREAWQSLRRVLERLDPDAVADSPTDEIPEVADPTKKMLIYNALIMAGLALHKQATPNSAVLSERLYRRAIQLDPDAPTAYQGLRDFYQEQLSSGSIGGNQTISMRSSLIECLVRIRNDGEKGMEKEDQVEKSVGRWQVAMHQLTELYQQQIKAIEISQEDSPILICHRFRDIIQHYEHYIEKCYSTENSAFLTAGSDVPTLIQCRVQILTLTEQLLTSLIMQYFNLKKKHQSAGVTVTKISFGRSTSRGYSEQELLEADSFYLVQSQDMKPIFKYESCFGYMLMERFQQVLDCIQPDRRGVSTKECDDIFGATLSRYLIFASRLLKSFKFYQSDQVNDVRSKLQNLVQIAIDGLKDGDSWSKCLDGPALEFLFEYGDISSIVDYLNDDNEKYVVRKEIMRKCPRSPIAQILATAESADILELLRQKILPSLTTASKLMPGEQIYPSESFLFPFFFCFKLHVENNDWNGALIMSREILKRAERKRDIEGLHVPKMILLANVCYAESLSYLGEMELNNAIQIYQSCLKECLSPSETQHSPETLIDTLLGLSRCFERQKKYTDALKCLQKAETKLNDLGQTESSRYHNVIRLKAWMMFHCNDAENALVILKQAIDCGKYASQMDHAEDLSRLGRIYWDLGAREEFSEYRHDQKYAFSNFIESLKLNPELDASYEYLGRYYLHKASSDEQESNSHKERAVKCFQKAFQKNAKNDYVGKILCDLYEERGEKEAVVALLQSITQNDTHHQAWAWKALGIANMERFDFVAAITALQNALRNLSKDAHLWALLAECYKIQGRYQSSLKAYERSLRVAVETNGISKYFDAIWVLAEIGSIKSMLGLFEESNQFFIAAQTISKGTNDKIMIPLVYSVAENQIAWSDHLYIGGFYGRAAESLGAATNCLSFILEHMLDKEPNHTLMQSSWKLLGDVLFRYRRFEGENVTESVTGIRVEWPRLRTIYASARDRIQIPQIVQNLFEFEDYIGSDAFIDRCLSFSASAYLLAVSVNVDLLAIETSTVWVNLGAVFHQLYLKNKENKIMVDYAEKCCLIALKIDNTSATAWNTFGLIMMNRNVKLSQHAFIKAIDLDSTSAIPWCNLSLLYVLNHDIELAIEATRQAQTVDPDLPQLWAIQAFISQHDVDEKLFSSLLLHATYLSAASINEINYAFAKQTYDELRKGDADSDPGFAIEALTKVVENDPSDFAAWNLLGTLCEFVQLHERAAESFEHARISCRNQSKDDIEKNLIRAASVAGMHSVAIEAYSRLSEQAKSDAFTLVNIALCYHFLGENDKSMEYFASALNVAEEKYRPTIILNSSLVLFAMGSPEHRQLATQQLLSCFQEDNQFIDSIKCLLAAGLAQQDGTLALAAWNETKKIPAHILAESDPRGQISYLGSLLHLMIGEEDVAKQLLVQAIHQYPASASQWMHLSQLLLRKDPIGAMNCLELCEQSLMKGIDSSALLQVMNLKNSTQSLAGTIFSPESLNPSANESIQKLLRIFPRHVSARLHLILFKRQVLYRKLLLISHDISIKDHWDTEWQQTFQILEMVKTGHGYENEVNRIRLIEADLVWMRARFLMIKEGLKSDEAKQLLQNSSTLCDEAISDISQQHQQSKNLSASGYLILGRCLLDLNMFEQAQQSLLNAHQLGQSFAAMEIINLLAHQYQSSENAEVLTVLAQQSKNLAETAVTDKHPILLQLIYMWLSLNQLDYAQDYITLYNQSMKSRSELATSPADAWSDNLCRLFQGMLMILRGEDDNLQRVMKFLCPGPVPDPPVLHMFGQGTWIGRVLKKHGQSELANTWIALESTSASSSTA